MAERKEANLGDRVTDKISGITGIVVGKTYWLYGCCRLTISPESNDSGKMIDSICVDEPQANIVKRGVFKPRELEMRVKENTKHGPREDAFRRKDVVR